MLVLRRAALVAVVASGLCAACTATHAPATPVPLRYLRPGRLDHRSFDGQPEWQRRTRKLVAAAEAALPLYRAAPGAPAVNPADFGADATGLRDSTQAFGLAVKRLLSMGGGRKNGANQTDLGGAVLDLGGGVFAVSQPIAIPSGYANYHVERGTIIAHSTFGTGAGQFLLQLGGVCGSATAGLSKNCATDISVSEVTLDGRDQAWGGVSLTSAVNVNVGPQVMVIGFQGVGIKLSGCGAGYVHDSWVGQYEAGDSNYRRSQANATAILFVDGEHDSDLENVIVFSGKVGVNSTNGANRIQGVHTWNLAGSSGGTGILLHNGAGRVQDAYLDYAPLVIRSPHDVQVTGCLFLGSSNIVLTTAKKWPKAPVSNSIDNMIITSNRWNTGNVANTTIILDETLGPFKTLTDSVIEDNEVGVKHTASKGPKKGTRATMLATVPPGKDTVELDFSDALVLPAAVGIAEARCVLSVTPGGGGGSSSFAPGLATQVFGGTKLRVTLGEPAPADGEAAAVAVLCDVDQSQRSSAAH